MSLEYPRGRISDPRPQGAPVTRKPSPSLAAKIKLLEANAEKRNNNSRLSPSPSPHRSRSRGMRAGSVSGSSEVSSAIEVPTSIPTTNIILNRPKELPPTPVEDDGSSVRGFDAAANEEFAEMVESAAGADTSQTEAPQDAGDNVQSAYMAELGDDSGGGGGGGGSGGGGGLHRRASLFSLSRVSFAAQLSRLTNLSLPLSEQLADKIRKLKTSAEMCEQLMSAGKKIGNWIDTAKKVLKGLDAEDDVEWAAQGKESLAKVDSAVKTFSGSINVYVEFIDELQSKPDSGSIRSETLLEIVGMMEQTVDGWKDVQDLLKGVRDQVETAMEWTELWTTILQDIQAELDACQTLLFESEERRHQSLMEGGASVDIDTLETIMEDNPRMIPMVNGRTTMEIEDSNLLGLFARMQPLRASLDFLPMRLQSFQMRAQDIFPTACEELESRRGQLERKWKKLNSDADSLKRELGEDRWVAIFRNAGRQANAMLDSIERSMNKLKESIILWEESGGRAERDLQKKMENYEAKKMHYGTAIQRTFSIIGKGINDRFTVNGEIIRLDKSLRIRWRNLEEQMSELDQCLKDLQLDAQALRDSITSLSSLDISNGNTPGTSPASSIVVTTSKSQDRKRSPTAVARRPPSSHGSSPSHIPKRSAYTRLSSTSSPLASPSIPTPTSTTRAPSRTSSRQGQYNMLEKRPRWNGSTKTDPTATGHNFKPLTLTTPSPYARVTPPTSTSRRNSAASTKIPLPNSLNGSPSISYRHFSAPSPSPSNRLGVPAPAERPSLRHQVSMGKLHSAYNSHSKKDSHGSDNGTAGGGGNAAGRPASAMAGRRSSLLPVRPGTPGKRASLPPGSTAGGVDRPRWRL